MVSKNKTTKKMDILLPSSLNSEHCLKRSTSNTSDNSMDTTKDHFCNDDNSKSDQLESRGLAPFCTQGICTFS